MSTIPTDRDVPDGPRPFPYRHEARASRPTHERHRLAAAAAGARLHDEDFARWAEGFGVIRHDDETQLRVRRLLHEVALQRGPTDTPIDAWRLFAAADRLTSAAMWLVVHMSYARRVRLDGEPVQAGDFKKTPEGHIGGSLNMVPAYLGYLLANAPTGRTRSWLMGQGHSVAAIEAVNALTGNLHPEQAARYDVSDAGLSRLCTDFYSYAIDVDGEPGAPLGSHVNAHTAGGLIEGGYLGFAELQYVHMPMPGETLVAFLSDGAFEEQRGADWAPRWWRANGSGLVVPVMILNGRRIEQRSSMEQEGGVDWFIDHLRLNGFDPIIIDGTDPAAFAWVILEAEARLAACAAKWGRSNILPPFITRSPRRQRGTDSPAPGRISRTTCHSVPTRRSTSRRKLVSTGWRENSGCRRKSSRSRCADCPTMVPNGARWSVTIRSPCETFVANRPGCPGPMSVPSRRDHR